MNGAAPLSGTRVVELAGQGPGPHTGMILADLGADVVRVGRPAEPPAPPGPVDPTFRGKRRLVLDLKNPEGIEDLLRLVAGADVLLEGFRPGVTERLGIGPDVCLARNPRLIYARVTGWGQVGPLAQRAGHDINYLGLTGALHAIGGPDRPVPPLNLVADFGGGSMLTVIGVLAALLERSRSGQGQVVDAAMVDGVGTLMQLIWSLHARGTWVDQRESNTLDGGAPFYRTYACADGRFVAVGCIEARFYDQMLTGLELDPARLPPQHDRSRWAELAAAIGAQFASQPRDHWTEVVFAAGDACVTPVLSLHEAPDHPHVRARGALYRVGGGVHAPRAPRFSRTPLPAPAGPDTTEPVALADVLAGWQIAAGPAPV